MANTNSKRQKITQEDKKFDARPVTESDIRDWCVKLNSCKNNGQIVTIPKFEDGMILNLDGPIMRVKVVNHKLLLVQVCTDKPARRYKVCQDLFYKRRISIKRIA